MRKENHFLQSRVARRIFALFVISALGPILFLAIVYQLQIGDLLLQQSHVQLKAASSNFSASIYDRLGFADQALRNATIEIAQRAPIEDVRSRVGTTFTDVSISRRDVRHSAPLGFQDWMDLVSPAVQQKLLNGDTSLVTKVGPDNIAHVYMIRLLDLKRPEIGTISGELNTDYLLPERDSYAHLIEQCLFDQNYIAVSCPPSMNSVALSALLAGESATSEVDLEWKGSAESMVGHFREVFLDAKFAVPRWVVVSGQRKSDAMDSLVKFNILFWSILSISALLAIYLSLVQIRRTLVPLKKLIDGTSQLGEKDFTAKVEIDSHDEFETLAQTFNTMAGRLGRQFDVMTTLSKIDRAILFELDMDRVIAEVLESLRDLYALKCASISILDRNDKNKLQVFWICGDHQQPMQRHEQSILAVADRFPAAHSNGFWTNAKELNWLGLDHLGDFDTEHFFCFPVASVDGTSGQLSLGFETRTELGSDDISHVRDFADRVGVALSSATREAQLFQQARFDGLTGLPNRFQLLEVLHQEVARTQLSGNQFAVLFIDLDRFKQVNDSLGHAAGDLLLQEAARRLRECVREGDTVARVGGDEFAIVVSELVGAQAVSAVANHVLSVMEPSFTIFGVENFVTASVGIVVYPQNGASATDLLRNADTAMYRAKSSGRSQYVFFEESMNAEVIRIATLDRELRQALSERQFVLHYQPQINLSNGDIVGVEALIRWRHPERGELLPEAFIDFAEDSGLIVPVGQLILSEVCRQFCEWRHAGVDVGHVSVNVSGRQFRDPGFADSVLGILAETGMPESRFAMEVTENVVIDDIDQVTHTLGRLKQQGISIELDDFGTGYSSMSYLEKLPVDTLKIDRAFIKTIDTSGRGGTMAKLILEMARTLNKRVVAEGVELVEQLDFLQQLGCDVGQGYLFSGPLSSDALLEFVNNWNALGRNQFFPRSRFSIVPS